MMQCRRSRCSGGYLKVALSVIAIAVLTLLMLWSCLVGGVFLLFYRS